jgi:integral membrane protein (TIGR01906 family)
MPADPPSTLAFRSLIVIMLPVVLVLGAVQLVATDQYLAFEYSKADFPPDPFGLTSAQRLEKAVANFTYVRQRQPLSALALQQFAGGPAYNDRELKHMQDVQSVYQLSTRVWLGALTLLFAAALAVGRRKDTRPGLASALKWSGLVSAGLVGSIGLFALVAWDVWFTGFHRVFFAPGTWRFEFSDTLIRLFPGRFWWDAALTVAGLTVAIGLILAGLGWRLERIMENSGRRAAAHSQESYHVYQEP